MGSYLEDKEKRIKREIRKKEKDMQRKRDRTKFQGKDESTRKEP